MHLLFDGRTYVCLGQVELLEGGGIRFLPSSIGVERFSPTWEHWEQEGMEVVKTFTQMNEGKKTTAFAIERVRMHSEGAFEALVEASRSKGCFVFSLDPARARYWQELSRWPISDVLKFELVFMVKNLSSQDLPRWDHAWKTLKTQVAV